MLSGAEACKSRRSCQELSNEYLLAKFGFDTAENEPLKVCKKKMANFDKKCDCRAVQRSALCTSRRELSNEYLLAKFGFDTAENELI